jgi:hypothetical protein
MTRLTASLQPAREFAEARPDKSRAQACTAYVATATQTVYGKKLMRRASAAVMSEIAHLLVHPLRG